MKQFEYLGVKYRAIIINSIIIVERQDGEDKWTRTCSLGVMMAARKALGV